jgi:hypothetical protein
MDDVALARCLLGAGALLLALAVLLATCSTGCGGGELEVVGTCPDAGEDAGPCDAGGE